MTDNNLDHTTAVAHSNEHDAMFAAFNLPDDYHTLAAMRLAIDTKMTEMQTAGAEALRKRIAEESAALGMTAEEIVNGASARKPRGRKPKSKHVE